MGSDQLIQASLGTKVFFLMNQFVVQRLKSSTNFDVKILDSEELAKEQVLLSQCIFSAGLYMERL